MPIYKTSSMEIFSSEGQWDHPCEVRIDKGDIVISYDDDGVSVLYKGTEAEPGHFKLTGKGFSGLATLHRFANADVLDGWYLEEGYEGMWRVTLDS